MNRRRRGAALVVNGVILAGLAVATAFAWPDQEAPAAHPTVVTSTVDQGRALFSAKGCGSCHSVSGHNSPFLNISLIDVPSRVSGMSRVDYIRQSIEEPQAVIAPDAAGLGAFQMPTLAVSPRELDALVAYLTDSR